MKIITIVLVLIFVGAVGYAFLSDDSFLISKDIVTSDIKNLLLDERDPLPVKSKAPEFVGLTGWINSEPLTIESLQGKVVLIDFWTYTCINCIRTLPHLESLYEKYRDDGFVLLGVHTPEFEFEKKRENVLASVAQYGLEYPIAQDNDYETWNAYANRYWPAHYLIDAKGNLRYPHFGEGRYEETERAVQELLVEAGLLTFDDAVEMGTQKDPIATRNVGTPEIYLGASRISNFGNPVEGVEVGVPHTFPKPETVLFNTFYFEGIWQINPEFSEFLGEEGSLTIRYKASNVNLVLSAEEEVVIEIMLDGKYLTDQNKGDDVFIEDGKSFMRVKDPNLYNIVRSKEQVESRTLELFLSAPGLLAFAFTFG